MDTGRMDDNSPDQASTTSASSQKKVSVELKELAHDYITLAQLKMQLAVAVGSRLMVFGIIMILALISAWIALIGAAIFALIRLGLAPDIAAVCLALINVVIACFCGFRMKQLGEWLFKPKDKNRGTHERTSEI